MLLEYHDQVLCDRELLFVPKVLDAEESYDCRHDGALAVTGHCANIFNIVCYRVIVPSFNWRANRIWWVAVVGENIFWDRDLQREEMLGSLFRSLSSCKAITLKVCGEVSVQTWPTRCDLMSATRSLPGLTDASAGNPACI